MRFWAGCKLKDRPYVTSCRLSIRLSLYVTNVPWLTVGLGENFLHE